MAQALPSDHGGGSGTRSAPGDPDARGPRASPPTQADASPRTDAPATAPTTAPQGRGASTAYPEAVTRLIEHLSDLPGIGRRSAERLAFHVLKSPAESAERLARALRDVKSTVHHCSACFNLTQHDPCPLCADPGRDRARVLVVEQPRDLIALEQTGMYKGLYHVLMGRISPLEGIGPDAITAEALFRRLDHPDRLPGAVRVEEVILGLNPTLEGDGTALYLTEQCAARGVRVSRLARGLPSGAPLEYASKAVLADAILGRQSIGNQSIGDDRAATHAPQPRARPHAEGTKADRPR